MIITVTLNPAIDKTITIEQLNHGGLNRISHVETDAGGKGINVSKTLLMLHQKSIATGFIAGNTGKTIQNLLNKCNIETDFIEVSGETRTNTKIFEKSGALTELNEPGPLVTPFDIEQLLLKLDGYAGKETLFVLAGSVPQGADSDIYEKIIRRVHKKGASVLLDADGELFQKALDAVPDMVKPNRFEFEEYIAEKTLHSEVSIIKEAQKLLRKGILSVTISMGADGAVFLKGNQILRCPALNVNAHSTVGAGDAMVAALAYTWDKDISFTETIKLCMAVSAGAVTTIGTKPPSKEVIDSLLKQVEINDISML